MACGTPVVTSQTGAAPEIAGEAAILVDPFDLQSIENGLELATMGEEPQRLRELGFIRARRFDWAAAATETIDAYRRC
jgi:glycosyltransferase involved in cell wall biosynthesis